MDNIDKILAKHRTRTSSLALMDLLRYSPLRSHRPADAGAVANLLAEGADPNFRSTLVAHGKGARPLLTAAKSCGPAVIALLLEAGAKPGGQQTDKKAALHLLPGNKDAAKIASMLLDAGAGRDVPDSDGNEPIHSALGAKGVVDYSLARFLLDAGASRESFLGAMDRWLRNRIAARAPKDVQEALAFLAERGESIHAIKDFTADGMRVLACSGSVFHRWETPELESDRACQAQIESSSLELFDILQSAGCHVAEALRLNSEHYGGSTPSLVYEGLDSGVSKKLLEAFVKAGASVIGESGVSCHRPGPARLAAQGKIAALRVAFELGLDKNWRDENGDGLLAWSMRTRYSSMREMMDFLLAEGVDPNGANNSGASPLVFALLHEISSVRIDLAKKLLAAGAIPGERQVGDIRVPSALASVTLPGSEARGVKSNNYRSLTSEIAEMLVNAGSNPDEIFLRKVNYAGIFTGKIPLLAAADAYDRETLMRHAGASASVAFAYWAHNGASNEFSDGSFFSKPQIDKWVAMGAKPSDMLACLRSICQRLGAGAGRRGESEAYLEALDLRESIGPEAGAARSGKRLSL